MTFYFDLGSPFAYLTAERIDQVVCEQVLWQPLSLGGLFKLTGRSSWALGDAQQRSDGMAEVERRARQYGLAPVRWPDPWPGNYLQAMRAATFAHNLGRAREFALTAFRVAFVEGLDLSVLQNVLGVGERLGIDPGRLGAAITDEQIKLQLRQSTERAHRLGVFGVPTFAVDGELFWGDDRLQDAARLAAS